MKSGPDLTMQDFGSLRQAAPRKADWSRFLSAMTRLWQRTSVDDIR